MKNRKAVSPLVAMVMLIGVTLLIAGILGTFATQFAVQQRQQIQYCTGARVLLLSGAAQSVGEELSDVTLNVQNFGDVDLTFDLLETFANGTVLRIREDIAISAGEIEQIMLDDTDLSLAEEFTIRSLECAGAQDLIRVEDIRIVS